MKQYAVKLRQQLREIWVEFRKESTLVQLVYGSATISTLILLGGILKAAITLVPTLLLSVLLVGIIVVILSVGPVISCNPQLKQAISSRWKALRNKR